MRSLSERFPAAGLLAERLIGLDRSVGSERLPGVARFENGKLRRNRRIKVHAEPVGNQNEIGSDVGDFGSGRGFFARRKFGFRRLPLKAFEKLGGFNDDGFREVFRTMVPRPAAGISKAEKRFSRSGGNAVGK